VYGIVVVSNCVISSYLLAKCNWKEHSVWTRKWINRRKELGALETLLKALAEEDQTSYRNHMGTSIVKFEDQLRWSDPKYEKMKLFSEHQY
jgi:hypothetical protein